MIRAEEGTASEIDSNTLSLCIQEPLGVVGQIIREWKPRLRPKPTPAPAPETRACARARILERKGGRGPGRGTSLAHSWRPLPRLTLRDARAPRARSLALEQPGTSPC